MVTGSSGTLSVFSDDSAVRLRHIAEQLLQISSNMTVSQDNGRHLADNDRTSGNGTDASLAPTRAVNRAAIARSLYAFRRNREAIFGSSDIFGEPAWDMLLDLFIAEQESKPLSVTSACIGAAVPTTTGLRWLNILERQGLVERSNDPGDARRTFVRLSAAGLKAMDRFMDQFGSLLD